MQGIYLLVIQMVQAGRSKERAHHLARHRYLNYALSVVTSRACPMFAMALPVQRRILYGMCRFEAARRHAVFEEARVVGEVMRITPTVTNRFMMPWSEWPSHLAFDIPLWMVRVTLLD